MIKVEIDWTIKRSVINRLNEIGLYWPRVTLNSASLERYTNMPFRAVVYNLISKSLEVFTLLIMWFLANAPSGKVHPNAPSTTSSIFPKILLVLILLAIVFYFSLWFSDRSERWSRQLLQRDPRPPILCLRVFSDDAKNSFNDNSRFFVNPITLIQRRVSSLYPKNKFGFHLRTKLSDYGPLITLANPARNIPVLGPNEVNVINEQWQKEILIQLDKASLIIVFAGLSNGLFWEMNQIVSRGLLQRTVLLIPPYLGEREMETLKGLVNLTRISADDASVEPNHRTEDDYSVLLLRELAERKELEQLAHVSISESLLCRWANNGELIIFTGKHRTTEAILNALSVCIGLSNTHEKERN